MKKSLFLIILVGISDTLPAQQFIESGSIEFEVRTNNHRILGDDPQMQIWKNQIPQLSTAYYSYTFAGNRSIYKLERHNERTKVPKGFSMTIADDDVWYNDYNNGIFINYRYWIDNDYLLTGELMKIRWILSPNETREIAGFNCRKATGIIFDSVYVFAFYTDEIVISGGPMGINGLSGMILGITIPRMYTSYIATKLQVTGVDVKKIAPPQKGVKKESEAMRRDLEKFIKDYGPYSGGQPTLWKMLI